METSVKKEAAAIVSGRVARRFFDDVYTLTYLETALTDRPFLNIGPGSFRHPNWRTADKKYGGSNEAWTEMRRGIMQDPVDYYWDAYSGERLSEKDNFFKVIYSSHVIEHLFPTDLAFFLSETLRLLEPGGVLRIVCPDAEQIGRAYKSRDWGFFMHYLIAKTGRYTKPLSSISDEALEEIAADFVIEWVSLLTHKDNPKHFNKQECAEFLQQHESIFDAFDEAVSLSSRELNKSVGGHVNWFSTEKITKQLESAGFSQVNVSGYLKSSVPILRDIRYFDRTDPEMSIYVEAVK
ncbi:Methyltransferase domain protein [compost metagenome]